MQRMGNTTRPGERRWKREKRQLVPVGPTSSCSLLARAPVWPLRQEGGREGPDIRCRGFSKILTLSPGLVFHSESFPWRAPGSRKWQTKASVVIFRRWNSGNPWVGGKGREGKGRHQGRMGQTRAACSPRLCARKGRRPGQEIPPPVAQAGVPAQAPKREIIIINIVIIMRIISMVFLRGDGQPR